MRECGPGVRVAHGSLEAAGFKKRFRERLMELVLHSDSTWVHAAELARYILLLQLREDADTSPLAIDYLFFKECFKSMLANLPGRCGDDAQRWRELIGRYKPEYLATSGYNPVRLDCPDSWAQYAANRMLTQHTNNVQQQFARRLAGVVHAIVGLRALSAEARQELRDHIESSLTLSRAVHDTVFGAVDPVKQAVGRLENIHVDWLSPRAQELLDDLVDVLRRSYPAGTTFESIFAHSKAQPLDHLRALVRLAAYCERWNAILEEEQQGQELEEGERAYRIRLPKFQALPLRTSWIPPMVLLDNRLAATNLLKGKQPKPGDPREVAKAVWGRLVNLKRRIFRSQGGREFCGTVMTDGVSIIVIKRDATKRPRAGAKRQQREGEQSEVPEFEYVSDLFPEELESNEIVVADPNRRDLLVFMHELSLPGKDERRVLRYTAQQRLADTGQRKREKQRRKEKPDEVREAERRLSRESPGARVYTPEAFLAYVRARASVAPVLREYYSRPFFRDQRADAYWRRQKADAQFVKMFKEAFGTGVTLVVGDWSRPNARHHQPMPGIRLLRLLRQAGIEVLLINEYHTSKLCSKCHQDLTHAKMVPNPRSYRAAQRPMVPCHGLRRCVSKTCTEEITRLMRAKWAGQDVLEVDTPEGWTLVKKKGGDKDQQTWHRLWDRDINACLNMLTIIQSLRAGRGVPVNFRPPPLPWEEQA